MSENRDLEIIKENTYQIKTAAFLNNGTLVPQINEAAERMAANIGALGDIIDQAAAKIKQLEDDLAEKDEEIERLSEPGIIYEDLEELFHEKHIDRDGPDSVIVPTEHWEKMITSFYLQNNNLAALKEASFNLYTILDNISTAGDMAKSDDVAFRKLTEKQLQNMGNFGVSSDGYSLFFDGKKIESQLAAKDKELAELKDAAAIKTKAQFDLADKYIKALADAEALEKELAALKEQMPVRCGECKKWNPPEHIQSRDPLEPSYFEPPYCNEFKTVTCENESCSRGVRR